MTIQNEPVWPCWFHQVGNALYSKSVIIGVQSINQLFLGFGADIFNFFTGQYNFLSSGLKAGAKTTMIISAVYIMWGTSAHATAYCMEAANYLTGSSDTFPSDTCYQTHSPVNLSGETTTTNPPLGLIGMI